MHNIPCLHVTAPTLAEAHEKALIELYNNGTRFKTQYDKKDDPPSIDATMDIVIENPMQDPMIHKAFPGGIEDLREYVMELQGNKDHWCKNMNDPNDTRWDYTYHGRFKRYGQWKELENLESTEAGEFSINQIEYVIEKLIKQPFTRQAQMITWMPNLDLVCYDPPCLQSALYRVIIDENNIWWLNCNMRIRSNDAWGASFMNLFGLTMFNREIIANEIEKRAKVKVNLARFNWHADSYHVYGKDIEQLKTRLIDRIKTTKIEDRCMCFYDPNIQEMYNEATEAVNKKIKKYEEEHRWT